MNSLSFRPFGATTSLASSLFALLLWLSVGLAARAQDVPPPPSPARLVNDLAHVMQPKEADALEQKLVSYNDSTTSQIAVVTVPSLGGNDIADYAQKLYESWGIGGKKNYDYRYAYQHHHHHHHYHLGPSQTTVAIGHQPRQLVSQPHVAAVFAAARVVCGRARQRGQAETVVG